MDALPAPVSGTLECLVLLGIGYNLRSTGVFSAADAQTALKIAGFTTLPAVILQACTAYPGLGWEALAGGAAVLLTALLSTAAAWGLNAKRHKRERAAIAGCCVGGAAASVGLPFIEAALGPAGIAAAAAALLCNTLAAYGASYLLFGSAGPAFPESYKHEDGGTYRGEWRGMVKEGLGVYRYPSGARYEGEWRGNLKDGRGVYLYPKGGTYEGEWSGGAMNGVGVRTYSNGRVVAGRWRANQLESPLELWQCAPAAEGAAEAALAARAVPVGGGRPRDALLLIAARPELWAAVVGLAAAAAVAAGWGGGGGSGGGAGALLGGAGAVVAALAPANKPLMLMASGMLLDFKLPDARQAADVFAIVATRTAAALFVAANALALLGAASPAAAGATAAIPAVLAALFVCLAPAPQAAKSFARNFRLNEALAGSAVDASGVAGAALCAAAALGATAAGLVPAAGSAAAAAAASTHFATALLALAAVLCVAAGPIHGRLSTDRRVRMVYKGPAAGGSQQQQQQQGSVSDAAAGSSAAAGGEQGGGGGGAGGGGECGSGGGGPKSPAAAAMVQRRQQGWRQGGGQQQPLVSMGRRSSGGAGVGPARVAPPRRAAAAFRPPVPPLRAVRVAAAARLLPV